MTFIWSTCSFDTYLNDIYVKYLPGDIYLNTVASSVSKIVAQLVAGLIYYKLGIKPAFSLLFGISTLGGLLILFLEVEAANWMPLFFILSNFGISGSFMIVYVCTCDVFPVLFCSTAMGICNFAARFFSIFSF